MASEKCFRDGLLYGASGMAIASGLLFGKQRNWALVALGGLGIFVARGGKLSADSLPKSLPSLPSSEELRRNLPSLPFATQAAINGLGALARHCYR